MMNSETPPPAAHYTDFAGEIQVENGPPPAWLAHVPRVAIILSLAYYLYVQAFDPVNLVCGGLLILWLVYTPIARKRGWFFIPM